MTMAKKYLATAAIASLPVISFAQDALDKMYTKIALFGKEVNQEQMYGLECAAGLPIGKYLSTEIISKYSHNLDKDNPISNLETGLYFNATTNNEKPLVGGLGVGIKGQSKFLQQKMNPRQNQKIEGFEPAIRTSTQLEFLPGTYFHAGWEYGIDTKENTILAGLRFTF